MRTNTSQKIPQKNPAMGQCYFALLFCIALPLILMDQVSEYALDMQTDRRVTFCNVLHITLLPFCVRLQRGEKHLLISVKFS